ncbi:MAG: DUF998 domain-containing protein [Thermofilaceae archaeon]
MDTRNLSRFLMLLGPLAFPAFHVVVLASVARNPWFDFYRHAFSDLGAPGATDPWIYNYGLIVLGAMMCLYSLGLLLASRSRGAAFACGLYFVAGIFLALIGVYPGGTRPHVFVSTWFYVQSFLATAALGLAMLAEKRRTPGIILLLLGLLPAPLGYLVEATVRWPSVAVAEYAGAVVIAVGALIAVAAHWR